MLRKSVEAGKVSSRESVEAGKVSSKVSDAVCLVTVSTASVQNSA